MQKELQMDLILQSLISLYSQFIVNFHMNKLDCTIFKLVNILVTIEDTLKSSRGTILAMKRTSSSKRKSGWKKKSKPTKKQKKESKPKKDVLKKAAVKGKCFHCDVDGHQRRNYLLYLKSAKIKCQISALKINCWLTHFIISRLNLIFIIFLLSIKDFFIPIIFMCP